MRIVLIEKLHWKSSIDGFDSKLFFIGLPRVSTVIKYYPNPLVRAYSLGRTQCATTLPTAAIQMQITKLIFQFTNSSPLSTKISWSSVFAVCRTYLAHPAHRTSVTEGSLRALMFCEN